MNTGDSIMSELSLRAELAEYLERNMSAFERMLSRAMALQVLYGWDGKRALCEAMREATA